MPTPRDALRRLEEGNARFVAGTPAQRFAPDTVRATSGRQHPYAAVLSCIDSRVCVEAAFDLAIGQAFSVRTAGNVVGPDALAGLEYACAVGGVRLVVVLGHTACGAVKGACDGVELGHLTGLLAKIRPSVEATAWDGDRTSASPGFVDAVAEDHARRAGRRVLEGSRVLRTAVRIGTVGVVCAMYDVRSGHVTFLTDLEG